MKKFDDFDLIIWFLGFLFELFAVVVALLWLLSTGTGKVIVGAMVFGWLWNKIPW